MLTLDRRPPRRFVPERVKASDLLWARSTTRGRVQRLRKIDGASASLVLSGFDCQGQSSTIPHQPPRGTRPGGTGPNTRGAAASARRWPARWTSVPARSRRTTCVQGAFTSFTTVALRRRPHPSWACSVSAQSTPPTGGRPRAPPGSRARRDVPLAAAVWPARPARSRRCAPRSRRSGTPRRTRRSGPRTWSLAQPRAPAAGLGHPRGRALPRRPVPAERARGCARALGGQVAPVDPVAAIGWIRASPPLKGGRGHRPSWRRAGPCRGPTSPAAVGRRVLAAGVSCGPASEQGWTLRSLASPARPQGYRVQRRARVIEGRVRVRLSHGRRGVGQADVPFG